MPAGEELAGVTLNGQPHDKVDRASGTINLTGHTGQLELSVQH